MIFGPQHSIRNRMAPNPSRDQVSDAGTRHDHQKLLATQQVQAQKRQIRDHSASRRARSEAEGRAK